MSYLISSVPATMSLNTILMKVSLLHLQAVFIFVILLSMCFQITAWSNETRLRLLMNQH